MRKVFRSSTAALFVFALSLGGCSGQSSKATTSAEPAANKSASSSLLRDSKVFTTTAGYCEWLNSQAALRLGRHYTPYGDMGQTEVGQDVRTGDAVQVRNAVQTECRDINGYISTQTPVWIADENNGASGYVDSSIISKVGQLKQPLSDGSPKAPPHAPLVTPPPLVVSEGYMVALNDSINNNKPGFDQNPGRCRLDTAHYYLSVGQHDFDNGHYAKARADAWSAYDYAQCESDKADKEDGDALLLFSKAEARLGVVGGAKQDAANAASSYVSCQNADQVYGEDDRQYCTTQMAEANRVAHGG